MLKGMWLKEAGFDVEISGTECFSLGYFVGDNNTPNEMSTKEYTRYREMNQAQRDEHRVLDVCPFCGKQSVHIRADEHLSRLVRKEYYLNLTELKSSSGWIKIAMWTTMGFLILIMKMLLNCGSLTM